MRRLLGLTGALCAVGAMIAPAAHATFPGKNGRIAATHANYNTCWLQLDPYACFNHSIFTLEPDGSGRAVVADQNEGGGLFSPDGTWLAYRSQLLTSCCYSDQLIWVMRADGTQKRLVFDGGLSLSLRGWSPDGRRLLFQGRSGRRCNSRTYALTVDSGEVVQYTGGPPCADSADASREGVWSQDSEEVAFVRPNDNEIWVSHADGTNAHRLLSVGGSVGEIATGISRSIAFTTGPRIEAIDWGGSNRRTLADLGTDRPRDLHWSSDGRRLLFTVDDGGFPYELFAVRDDGSGFARIADDVTSGVWSPDGRQVAFTGLDAAYPYPDDELHSYSYALFRVNVDGTGRTQLTSTPDGHHVSDWQAVSGPERSDYKNAAQFCKAERDFWGDQFASRYGGASNAYGKCVSGR